MNYLSVEQLSKTFGDRTILDNISFGVDQGQKVALVGINGSGKSTLLKILSGIESPDKGVVVFKNELVVRHLLQNPAFEEGQSILDAVFDAKDPSHQLLKQYEKAMLKNLAGEENHEEVQRVLIQMDEQNAWELETQAKQILGKLGLHELDQDVSKLSGGQQKRVALAQALIHRPDLLILDEPTNHLDIETIEWLENYLSTANMALILVTHDRYFLEKVTNHIVALERGSLFSYQGDYAYFLERKAERKAQESSSIDKAKNHYRKELDWIRRQPKARGTKAKYRVDAFEDTKQKAFSAQKDSELQLGAKAARQGKKILEVDQLSFGYNEDFLIKDFSYIFQRKEKVGIVGPNGSGKTTFIQLLQKELLPKSGEVIKGETTKFGYYRQIEPNFDEQQKVIDFAKSIAEVVEVGKGRTISVSQFLTQFLFPPEVQYKPISILSGGEKRRLQLLQILIKSPNFLVLDEPTNDLDLLTLNVLEDYLENFEGSLLIISHDRYFMDRLVDHLFVFEGDGFIKDYPGNYTDWRASLVNVPKPAEKKKIPKPEAPQEQQEKRKLSYQEKQEFDNLEKEIPALEQEKAKLIALLTNETDHEKLSSISKEIEALTETLDEKELRWLELSDDSQ